MAKYCITLMILLFGSLAWAQSAQVNMAASPQKLMRLQAEALKTSKIAAVIAAPCAKATTLTADHACGCCYSCTGAGCVTSCGCELCRLERPNRRPDDVSPTNLNLVERLR